MSREDPFYSFTKRDQSLDSQEGRSIELYGDGDIPEFVQARPDLGGEAGDESDENQDAFSSEPWAITVNGSTNEDGVQAAPFTIACNSGNAVYFGNQSVNFNANAGVSVNPGGSVGDTTSYRVFGEVTGTMNSDFTTTMSGTGSIIISQSTTSETAGSNTRWEYLGLKQYKFYVLVGTVTVRRLSGGLYRVTITQIQTGVYKPGGTQGGNVTSDDATVPADDGPRTVILCINGAPFECELDITGLRAPSA